MDRLKSADNPNLLCAAIILSSGSLVPVNLKGLHNSSLLLQPLYGLPIFASIIIRRTWNLTKMDGKTAVDTHLASVEQHC